jgi:hypothetical protein
MAIRKISLMKGSFSRTLLATLFILLCNTSSLAGKIGSTSAASESKNDVIATLDRLFQRSSMHRVEMHPQDSNLFRVARGGSDQGSVTSASWCGSHLLMFGYGFFDPVKQEPPSHGGFLVDLDSRKIWRLGKLATGERIGGCTVDGEWFIYHKKFNKGQDLVFGRYNLRTGKKEDMLHFKGSEYLPSLMWSPDGSKILYTQERTIVVLMTSEPIWKLFWGKRWKFPHNGFEVTWLGDSSGVLVRYASNPNDNMSERRLAVDRTGDPLTPLEVLLTPSDLSRLKVDSSNRVYGIKNISQLQRCIFGDKALQCEPAIADDPAIDVYDITSDGSVIFYADSNMSRPGACLWRYEIVNKQKTCLWKHRQGTILLVSPDGYHLAFQPEGLYPPNKRGETFGFAIMRVK